MAVQKATEQDLEAILSWLKTEYQKNDGEGFWCNRGIIEGALSRGDLWVIHHEGEAVAFQVGDYAADIACVRTDLQRRGFGKELYRAALRRARRANVNILRGECVFRSFPFWQKLGFESEDGLGDLTRHAHRIVDRKFRLPKDRPSADVSVSFYPEKKLYEPDLPALQTWRPRSVVLNGGDVMLEQRAMGFAHARHRDLVVEIELESVVLCLCKAKREQAAALGVQKDDVGNTFFVDVIKPPKRAQSKGP